MNAQPETLALQSLRFDNTFTRDLPADPVTVNRPRPVIGASWSRVQPKPATAPRLVAFSRECAALLELSEKACLSETFTQVFAGNALLPGMEPHATCYGGHQFGAWAGQLGDGRAINLGELVNGRGQRFTLQLKGAGPTPYSRGADGFAVLRSSVREFLCSEAMHHLGVPTTRALSLVLTGDLVERDMFYDGRPQLEPGAVVCRVSPSFVRFGHFQILAARDDLPLLERLAAHVLRHHYPDLGEPRPDALVAFFEEVCRRTLDMVVHWMRVGFVHGVMNTDNMSILGETIDYGPYGWLEGFDPDWTPNTTDAQGRRYRYGHQPQIALWNLVQLANALLPLVGDPEPLQAAVARYGEDYAPAFQDMMRAKLGLAEPRPEEDARLVDELIAVLQGDETDMAIFFRALATLAEGDAGADDEALLRPLVAAFYDERSPAGEHRERLLVWLRRWLARAGDEAGDGAARAAAMRRVNPRYVLRNYLAQEAIDACAGGDNGLLHELLDVLRRPYDEQPGRERFAARRPEWARHRAGCSMLSCSS